MLRIRLRFSLRTLLVAMTIVPAAAYWIGLPTLNAHRYWAALEAGDYEAAERLCVVQQNPHPGKMKAWLSFDASARIKKATWNDLIFGRRRMTYFWEAHMGSAVMAFKGVECVATQRGIEFPGEAKPSQ